MARKNNLFNSKNNMLINLFILLVIIVLLYFFLRRCNEKFTDSIDDIKTSFFKPGTNDLVIMYYAPWCYYSKIALTGENGFGTATNKTDYDQIQSELGFKNIYNLIHTCRM